MKNKEKILFYNLEEILENEKYDFELKSHKVNNLKYFFKRVKRICLRESDYPISDHLLPFLTENLIEDILCATRLIFSVLFEESGERKLNDFENALIQYFECLLSFLKNDRDGIIINMVNFQYFLDKHIIEQARINRFKKYKI